MRWKVGGLLAVLALVGLTGAVLLTSSGDDDTPSGTTLPQASPSLPAPQERETRQGTPSGFFGTVFNLATGVDPTSLDRQFALMARSGVETVRVPVFWAVLEPARGTYDWVSTDALVAAAARARVQLLANVLATPGWASQRPQSARPERWPPRDPAWAGTFMRRVVERYGSRGTFWAENPSVPRSPVRWWQIWNEPMGRVHWPRRPWPESFTRLLRATSTAIHQADPGAKVVPGALATFGEYTSWDGARDLYRAGARRHFDVLAVHPFTNGSVSVAEGVDRVVRTVELVRREMRRRGDAAKPVIITELSWPAAVGRVPRERLLGLETTARGQAQRLRAAYARLGREWRRLNLRQVHWFNWASEYDADSPAGDVAFRFSGLTKLEGGAFTPQPLLRTYARAAGR